jgi:hypothetical protein
LNFGVAEEAGQAAGVPEHDRRADVEAAVAHGGDEAGHGPAGVNGVEQEALGPGGQPDRGGGGLGQAGVAGADLVGAQPQRPRGRRLSGDRSDERGDDLARGGDGAGVHAEHVLGSELGDQSGHSAARADGDDRGRLAGQPVGQLGAQFTGRIGVGQGAVAVAAAEGDDRGVRAGRGQLGGGMVGGNGELAVVGVTGPPDARAEDLVEQEVPSGRVAGASRGAG